MPTRLPRLNVTVTEEQHALLVELSALQGRSSASFLREMLDAATPLLRATVPTLRLAAQEMEITQVQARDALREPLAKLHALGMIGQIDWLDALHSVDAAPDAIAASASKRGRSGRGSPS